MNRILDMAPLTDQDIERLLVVSVPDVVRRDGERAQGQLRDRRAVGRAVQMARDVVQLDTKEYLPKHSRPGRITGRITANGSSYVPKHLKGEK